MYTATVATVLRNTQSNTMQNNIAQYVTKTDEGYMLEIALNEQFNNVRVESVTMFVSSEQVDEDFWGDGDLAVNWDTSGLTSDEIADIAGKFYWNDEYNARLQNVLLAAGFSSDAASDVATSEWGMQDDGRASYDAALIADEVRAAVK